MNELQLKYANELANHLIIISALLAGFSIAFIANIIVQETKNKITKYLLIIATLTASSFLVSLFALTKILMVSSEGYPFEIDKQSFILAQTVSQTAFGIGLICILALISVSGWTKSKAIGVITTIMGLLTFIIIRILFN